jgi:3-methyl-2-oxobutanoate hydroxymethyltransferase
MPFMSYQISVEQAMANAGRLMKETGAGAVKLEGGERVRESIKAMVEAGIPVMGHVGMTPQSVHGFGGFKVQGKGEAAERVMRDALAVQEGGAFSVVLEAMPKELGKEISRKLAIPTIGIGGGPDCDGQVLVLHDLLGIFEEFVPKFVKRYAEMAGQVREAVSAYVDDVKKGAFPTDKESYG